MANNIPTVNFDNKVNLTINNKPQSSIKLSQPPPKKHLHNNKNDNNYYSK